MRTFLLFCLLCAVHVTLADRVRDRQHREWRRKAASLQEEQPYQTATTSLPSEPSHILQRRATTGTGVWTSTGPSATVIITTARISSRCECTFLPSHASSFVLANENHLQAELPLEPEQSVLLAHLASRYGLALPSAAALP